MEAGRNLLLAIDGGDESDAREVAELTTELRQRLLELDVDKVEPVRSQDIPEGAKPGDAITIGALSVTLTPAVITAVIGLVKTWLGSRPVRAAKVTIEGDSIEVSGLSTEGEQQLIEGFLERHASGVS